MGWRDLYPTMEAGSTVEACNTVAKDMFDHSFILSMITSVYLTEWYLSEEFGMTMSSKDVELKPVILWEMNYKMNKLVLLELEV